MKKQLLLLLIMFLPLVTMADAIEIDGIYYILISKGDSKGAEVTKSPYYNKYKGIIEIPETIVFDGESYQVTSIGGEAFSGCKGLSVVKIPPSVISIGKLAFYDCSSLKVINIPRSVNLIGENAFRWCKNLERVDITDLESWCNITFPPQYYLESNPLFYAQHLYMNDEEIKDLIIPNTITTIKPFAFVGCSGLSSLTIHQDVTSIGYSAFAYCSGISSLYIPDGVITIGNYAFEHCSSVNDIRLPSCLESIGEFTFYACQNLKSIIWPSKLLCIGKAAFGDCSKLQTIAIPEQVTTIEENAFSNCSSMTSVKIGKKIRSIGEKSFGFCQQITDVYCNALDVPATHIDAFASSYIEYAKLHVPEEAIGAYKLSTPWKNFKEVVVLTEQNLDVGSVMGYDKDEVALYTTGGQRIIRQTKGLNIVKKSDGTTMKVVVK